MNGILSSERIVIFTGAYGSGKTEVAISYARAALAAGRRTALADLDIVTPYFRVGDLREELQREGLSVIAAPGALASFELPALSPELSGTLADGTAHTVLDVGGDPDGARLLGVYAEVIRAAGYDLWLVANPYRPATPDAAALVAQAHAIARESGLAFTGLVANPHLASLTRPDDVLAGLARVEEAARQLDLPLVGVAIERELAARISLPGRAVLPLRLALCLPWERRPEKGAGEEKGT